ncbi:TIGR02444 family protein [Franzmannia pantelleriensis]|uniref:TIGR02444 family protein n=1 Tax=Franzmannia pantelleriensis TaxID=48727 RepID=A0A1G9T8K6_9GAMM|nr:TIGR02444 family protein [Halomonas pantelleriensis]SDM43952.1 TIGR02444 family protein [Halomonas pantelleriensis]
MDSTQLLARLRACLGDAPLWDFALAFYGREEIAATCLQLQDEAGADVCELLWHCWLDSLGLVAQGSLDDELGPLRRWQAEITQPLRQQRRALKKQALTNPEITELRNTIKQAELLAEREALRMLQRISEEALGSADWIRPLTEADAALGQRLYARLPEQKKHHLYALQTLESRLDPFRGAR